MLRHATNGQLDSIELLKQLRAGRRGVRVGTIHITRFPSATPKRMQLMFSSDAYSLQPSRRAQHLCWRARHVLPQVLNADAQRSAVRAIDRTIDTREIVSPSNNFPAGFTPCPCDRQSCFVQACQNWRGRLRPTIDWTARRGPSRSSHTMADLAKVPQ